MGNEETCCPLKMMTAHSRPVLRQILLGGLGDLVGDVGLAVLADQLPSGGEDLLDVRNGEHGEPELALHVLHGGEI